MYLNAKSRLLKLISSPEFGYEFGRFSDMIRQSVRVMIKHLDELIRERRVEPTDRERSIIASATNRVIAKIIYDPITPFLREFITLYVEVLKNWNAQIGYQYDIDIMVDTIHRLISQHMTLMDAVNVMKQLIKRVEDILKYEPPAFTLARHYLEVIQKKFDKGEPINEYERAKRESSK